ncbi:maleylpyruvate isomerase family mycothiol-dependent enzyme [Pseudonocardia sp. KRD-182]|nr:maleylpyruvate isomerase family mycothiol-dependent enzyme [Pseudonocardia oceani]
MLVQNNERFLALAREFGEADWAAPSLCSGWTNHHVLAHLVVGCGAGFHEVAREMVSARGRFDDANTAMARTVADARPPAQLLEELEALVARPQGIGAAFPKNLLLGDHVIHELDIVFALGRDATVTDDALTAVLRTEVGVPNPFVPARRRARGLTLHATDLDWSRPDGSQGARAVHGAAADLASVLAGRPAALSRLHGTGVEELRARVG